MFRLNFFFEVESRLFAGGTLQGYWLYSGRPPHSVCTPENVEEVRLFCSLHNAQPANMQLIPNCLTVVFIKLKT